MDAFIQIKNYLAQGEHPIELIKLIVMALIARWSLNKFFKEKKWEKKSQSYTNIIESLYRLKQRCERDLKQMESQQNNPDSSDSASSEDNNLDNYRLAMEDLKKYLDTGRFYISRKALKSLEVLFHIKDECINDWECGGFILDVYEKELEATKKCLQEIINIASKEL